MRIAKFPHHKDFATAHYGAAAVTQTQIEPFCSGQFTEEAHNLILVGGTGTGKDGAPPVQGGNTPLACFRDALHPISPSRLEPR